jgi:hypothetical protein
MVVTLCYNSEGRGFDYEWGLLVFFFPIAPNPSDPTGTYSAYNKNEYKKISGGKARPAFKADNLSAIYEPTV